MTTTQPHAGSELLNKIVLPAMANAEHEFGIALGRINLEDMARERAGARASRVAAPRRT